jgi:5-formyltetrahydrofolate cyclo-ligase
MTGETINIQSIDAAFVPLLAFDKNGQRVGYGKGFYDRFLSEAPREMLKIGLSFFSPVDGIDDIDFFDKKLDFCITPDQVYAF